MSFRKRNIGITRTPSQTSDATSSADPGASELSIVSRSPAACPGTRPSPIDGRLTTSTGISSLDALLAGHSGLPLGNSVLIEEHGTTDFAGVFLRLFAAEGVVQGHQIHVAAVSEQWARDLPGLSERKGDNVVGDGEGAETSGEAKDKMKIAWRYERLGEFGAEKRRGPTPERAPSKSTTETTSTSLSLFTHTFDLTTRLALPQDSPLHIHPLSPSSANPFASLLTSLRHSLSTSPDTIHRLILPTLLTPPYYPPSTIPPTTLLPFLHSLRSLLRQNPNLIIISSLPLSLYPRTSPLTRTIELLFDGVITLSPFSDTTLLTVSGGSTKEEERPQGMLYVHKLPVRDERGGGVGTGGEAGGDWAFSVSKRRVWIRAWSLPPVEGDREAQETGGPGGNTKGLEF